METNLAIYVPRLGKNHKSAFPQTFSEYLVFLKKQRQKQYDFSNRRHTKKNITQPSFPPSARLLSSRLSAGSRAAARDRRPRSRRPQSGQKRLHTRSRKNKIKLENDTENQLDNSCKIHWGSDNPFEIAAGH